MSFDNSNADGLGIQEHSKGPVFPVVESIIGHHDIGPDAESYVSIHPSGFELHSPTRGGQRRNSNLLLRVETLTDIAWGNLQRDGGFSLTIDGSPPVDSGFMVSRIGHEVKYENPRYGDLYRYIVERYLDGSVSGSQAFFGGWYDAGTTYFDVSDWVAGLESAKYLGKARGQIAIYGIASGTSIYL